MVRSSKAHPVSWVIALAAALAQREDIDLHLITATSGIQKSQTVSKNGITFHLIRHTFPFSVRGFPDYMRLDLLTGYAQLRRGVKQLLRVVQPDVIHIHGTEYGYGLAVLNANAPAIVSIQGIVNELARVAPSMFYTLQSRIERTVIRNASYFGTRTAWANGFIRKLNGTAAIYHLPEAINPLFFAGTGQETNANILIVGRILQPKGIEEALAAMSIVVSQIPSAKLLVVGNGAARYLEELKRFIKLQGIQANVEWLGFRKAEEVAALHKAAAILIHPSHLDNSPNSVAEAMASGLPVIASRVGGIPSMIEDRVTGLLTEPRNPRELAEAIVWLLQNEPERKRLARRAQKVAFERHFPSRVAEKTMSVYKELIAREKTELGYRQREIECG
jgi:glycosyltransferase involved in cell wall biosynthesis